MIAHVLACDYDGTLAERGRVPDATARALDNVTRAPGTHGVVELIEAHLLKDLAERLPPLARHQFPLGEGSDEPPVAISHLERTDPTLPLAGGVQLPQGTFPNPVRPHGNSLPETSPGSSGVLAGLGESDSLPPSS